MLWSRLQEPAAPEALLLAEHPHVLMLTRPN